MKISINKKFMYLVLLVVLLFALMLLTSSCSKNKQNYCNPPKAINGMCHSECGSPYECHLAFPGDKGPGCSFGQVCNDACYCEWVDKDLDGFPLKNLGLMGYPVDCDDTDPTIFLNASELCDNKDNDCDGQIDEDGVCDKNIFFCSKDGFDNGACLPSQWCSANTLNTSASCDYPTTDKDLGNNEAYVFVCDNYFSDGNYGCYKAIKGSFSVLTTCNNNNIKDATEECDGSDLGSLGCADFGYQGGDLTCDHCAYSFDYCRGLVCNHNNYRDPGEECDGSDFDGKTCGYFGLGGNNLRCNDACLLDKAGCSITTTTTLCGNNVIDVLEDCEGSNLNGKSCKDLGFSSGELSCNSGCSYDYSKCSSVSCDNDNIAEIGEACDGSDLDGRGCQDFGFSGGSLECKPNCDYNFSKCSDYSCDNNGTAELGEACDSSDLRLFSCKDFDMFKGGLLKCDSLCMFDSRECSLVCDNDNIAELGEECDGSDLRQKNCDGLGRYGGDLSCTASCNYNLSACGPSCLPDWSCTEWSNCSSMEENTTRSCTDLNSCNSEYSKPLESKPCDPSVCEDNDNDTYCACTSGAVNCDCDDANAAVHPGSTELCNSKDDNCDATIDDNCPCTMDMNRSCGVNEGLCKEGIQRCINGYWSICSGSDYIGPIPEICNNALDEDCDGYSDEGCICTDNSTEACGTDVGECEKGIRTCFAGNWSACSGKTSLSEVCTGSKDEDCDGFVDCNDSDCSSSPFCTGIGSTSATPTCFDGKKNQGETNVDCGGPCPACENICGYGEIKNSCRCEGSLRTSGYCCDGNYHTDSCSESCTDSDTDSLCDADEVSKGTDPNNRDTDGDGISDNTDANPLCNANGKCDSARDYPESIANCPEDCGAKTEGLLGKSLGSLWWVITAFLILIFGLLILYLIVKRKSVKKESVKKYSGEPKVVIDTPISRISTQPSVSQKQLRDISTLVAYFDNSLKKGEPKLKLRESALKAGWTAEEINEAFGSLEKAKKETNKRFFRLFKK